MKGLLIFISILLLGVLLEGGIAIEQMLVIQRQLCGIRARIKGCKSQSQRGSGDQKRKDGSPVLKQILEEIDEDELNWMS